MDIYQQHLSIKDIDTMEQFIPEMQSAFEKDHLMKNVFILKYPAHLEVPETPKSVSFLKFSKERITDYHCFMYNPGSSQIILKTTSDESCPGIGVTKVVGTRNNTRQIKISYSKRTAEQSMEQEELVTEYTPRLQKQARRQHQRMVASYTADPQPEQQGQEDHNWDHHHNHHSHSRHQQQQSQPQRQQHTQQPQSQQQRLQAQAQALTLPVPRTAAQPTVITTPPPPCTQVVPHQGAAAAPQAQSQLLQQLYQGMSQNRQQQQYHQPLQSLPNNYPTAPRGTSPPTIIAALPRPSSPHHPVVHTQVQQQRPRQEPPPPSPRQVSLGFRHTHTTQPAVPLTQQQGQSHHRVLPPPQPLPANRVVRGP
ncbi:hypothetical protein Pelo_14631 [Pelomyxa schiedti]|nr:hypothetical protein Pelo_14631 [Pelomyxa schiedti]